MKKVVQEGSGLLYQMVLRNQERTEKLPLEVIGDLIKNSFSGLEEREAQLWRTEQSVGGEEVEANDNSIERAAVKEQGSRTSAAGQHRVKERLYKQWR